jgi:DNA polymerase III subunit gamma/tau
MSFIVSARKYRPARFHDVVGQQHVTQTLQNAIQTDQLAHAFLFTGPRGVGKTTCARILAKVLNCLARTPDTEACDKCSSCKSFNENASFNVIELDAASNNSVENIRSLIEQVRFQPQQGKYKVFIIDEVHMLSAAAFNAFLKTLEEPPAYAKFILATTEKHKILPTIISRCQIFDFRRILPLDIVHHLAKIAIEEHITADTAALHIIAQKADGGLRDALSIFDRIVSFSAGQAIDYQGVINNLNVLDFDYYFKITDGLLTEDIGMILNLLDDVVKRGFEPDIFLNGLGEHFRNLLVAQMPQTLKLLEVGETWQKKYIHQASLAPSAFILNALNITNECDIHYKTARNKKLHIEMALIKMAFLQRAVAVAINPTLASAEKKTPDVNKPTATITATTTVAQVSEDNAAYETKVAVPPPPPEIMVISDVNAIRAQLKAAKESQANLASRLTPENLIAEWQAYIEKSESQMLKNALLKAEYTLKDKVIHVKVGSNYAKNTISQDSGFIAFLSQALATPNISLKIEVDTALLPVAEEQPERKKNLTPRDKYIKMRETNPLIEELQRKFELKPED